MEQDKMTFLQKLQQQPDRVWVGYVLFAYMLVFLLLILLKQDKPDVLSAFIDWSLGMTTIITAGVVAVHILTLKKKAAVSPPMPKSNGGGQ